MVNDNLCILYIENFNAKIAVKTHHGMMRRITTENIIMQGTVWGTPACTSTMDQLAKIVYSDTSLQYKYKGEVVVPPLMMVDDILTLQKCNNESLNLNALTNAFIEGKKLMFNM